MNQADIVELADVRFAWPCCDGVVLPALKVARGERVFLHGASGSGKSTLLNLLSGVLRAQAGTVRVLGEELGSLSGARRDRFRAEHLIVFQLFNLIPYLSVIENVCLPCRFAPERRQRALRAGGTVAGEARRLLANLDLTDPKLLQRSVTALSVGQQQRVAAARALIGAPELVLADEPTSALDADRRAAFLDLLFRQCGQNGTTLLFASHDALLAPLFDRSVEVAPHAMRSAA